MYKAYITRIKNLRKHSNADRLQVGECFGNNVIVSLDYKENQLGVYFPVDGKLGIEYATENNLLRKKDENGKNIGGYLDPDKRNITAIKLRGEKSDGLFMPLESLQKFTNIQTLTEGTQIDILNKVTICEKYIPRPARKPCSCRNHQPKKKVKNKADYPYFEEHVDTEQLAYNLGNFKKGDTIYITLKMHGTSQRTARTIKNQKVSFFTKLFSRKTDKWEIVTGTRRVTLHAFNSKTSFYGSDLFRKTYHDFFATRLRKGEEVFYEVLGYTDTDNLIMGECNNEKTKDPEFIRQYGSTTKFEYGCKPSTYNDGTYPDEIQKFAEMLNVEFVQNKYPQNRIFVYRMTMTNEDGDVVEYPTELVMRRCEEMGVPFVPVFDKFIFTTKAALMKRVEKYYDGPDPIGKSHIREGVVVRIDNRPKFTAYKHKNFNFKVLEGIVKADAAAPDMEEAQDVTEE